MKYSPQRHRPGPAGMIGRTTRRRVFKCLDCDNVPDCPMLHDQTWLSIAGGNDILCIYCTEHRLGRRLELSDLRLCAGNQATLYFMTRERAPPQLLSDAERKDLLTHSEQLWADLQENDLGGFGNGNRPFYIVWKIKEAIERFGYRDVGLNWSKNDLDALNKKE